MGIPVVAPVSVAIERTKAALFQPFNLSKWFAIGLSAWLASFVSGDAGGSFNFPGSGGGGGGGGGRGAARGPAAPGPGPIRVNPPAPGVPGVVEPGQEPQPDNPQFRPVPPPDQHGEPADPDDAMAADPDLDPEAHDVMVEVDDESPEAVFRQAMAWVRSNLGLVLGIGAAVLLVAVTLGLLFLWLGCRGQFLFLDNIARDSAEISEPWGEYASEANSLFGFQVGLVVLSLLLFAAGGGAGVALAWPDIMAGQFGGSAALGLVVGLLLAVPLGLAFAAFSTVLHDFVTPIMYSRRVNVMPALGVFRSEVLPGNVGSLVLYFLLKIVLSIGVGILKVMAGCATCCIGFLPYIGTVITLPLPYFMKSYSLAYLEQVGPDFRIVRGGRLKPLPPPYLDPEALA